MYQEKYPILEFDPTRRAILEPSEVFKPIDISEYCVMCFFKDIIEKVAQTSGAGWLSKKPSTGWPFSGGLMNLPPGPSCIWADAGQFGTFFWGQLRAFSG